MDFSRSPWTSRGRNLRVFLNASGLTSLRVAESRCDGFAHLSREVTNDVKTARNSTPETERRAARLARYSPAERSGEPAMAAANAKVRCVAPAGNVKKPARTFQSPLAQAR